MKIKFRFWLTNINEYVYWEAFEELLTDQLYDYFNSNHITPEPFTGQYDKNGKEIYAGDVVVALKDFARHIRKGEALEVYYNEFLCHFALIDAEYNEDKHGAYDMASLTGAKVKYLEVVGTIHDNVELNDEII